MKYLFISILLVLLVNCKLKKDDSSERFKQSKIKISYTTFNFGKITIGDTVNCTFFIKNISEEKFIIDTVGTSCGCTTTTFTKDSVQKNGFAKINIQYIADNVGKISKSIVASDNTQQSFHTFYLKGSVVSH
ncbi:DUF1573 domain-containing protein [Flavobacterium sp. JAS]|uniref:DUF1573 domain-containing protein n=1 Tax=Flavobacterium sp. JAS TaxID=2897329 RepID=UPI001E3D3F46|nr:DUF1573 domain-containing protein [Flavobacterium sp. JAS]MCD0472628.1 DUF1573 domain-containing protein [Flavobacterium sp. JAS]